VSDAELASLDGHIAPSSETFVPATDEGLLRGDGVFEVVRIYDGVPFALSDHLDRIQRSASNLRLGYEPPRDVIQRETAALLAERDRAFDGALRIVLTRGGRRLLLTEPMPPMAERIRLGFVTYAPTRLLDGVKSLSYAPNMLAGRLARERGFDEALLVTPHGRVLEATTSSLFWVDQQGTLCTPPLDDHILASITRDRLLSLMDVEERPATMDDVLGAEEAFLASTIREVQSVATVEDREFPAEIGETTRRAARLLRAHIEESLRAVSA
jgi:branched-chain amino acid aminotransferase